MSNMNGREQLLANNDYDLVNAYDEMLDEVYGMVEVAGMMYDTSRLLSECDPIAYRCGFNDYLDSIDYDEDDE